MWCPGEGKKLVEFRRLPGPVRPNADFASVKLNNAVVLQYLVYLKELALFERVYQQNGQDLRVTLARLTEAAKKEDDPFAGVRALASIVPRPLPSQGKRPLYRQAVADQLTYSSLSTIIVCSFDGWRNSMTEKVSTLEVRQKLGDILNRVALRHDQFIIERKGKPLAAMVPIETLAQMQRAARLHLRRVLDQQPGDLSQEDADRLANEATHRTRKPTRK